MRKKVLSFFILISGITLLLVLFLGYLGKYYRFCDVLSNFKEQLFLAALFLLIATLFSKILQKTNLTVLGLIIVVTFLDILPWYCFDHGQEKGSHFFRVSLINVLKRNKSYEDVIKLVDNLAPDLLVLMEIDDEWFTQLLPLDAEYQHKIVSSKLGNEGILVYSTLPILKYEEIILSPEGRPNLKITLDVDGQKIDCLIAHPVSPTRKKGKWEDRNIHLVNLAKLAKSAQNPLIIVADLNVSMWSPFYMKLIENTQMKNARKGFGIHGTYPAPLATISGVPIDHILLDEFFCCQDFKIGPYIGSDHLPIWADISF